MSVSGEFDQLVVRATGMQPYPYQRRLAVDGLPEVLAVPTGAGKTMAAVLPWLFRRRFHHARAGFHHRRGGGIRHRHAGDRGGEQRAPQEVAPRVALALVALALVPLRGVALRVHGHHPATPKVKQSGPCGAGCCVVIRHSFRRGELKWLPGGQPHPTASVVTKTGRK